MRRTTFARQPVIVAALLLASAYTAAATGIDYLIAPSGPEEAICETAARMKPDDDIAGAYRRAVVRNPADREIRRSPRAGTGMEDRPWGNDDVSFREEHKDRLAQRRPGARIDASAKAA